MTSPHASADSLLLLTPAQMRELDAQVIGSGRVPGMILMEHAGAALARAARRHLPDAPGARVVALCGKGNNGGDGFAAARHLQVSGGAHALCIVLAGRAEIRGDALAHLTLAENWGVEVRFCEPGSDPSPHLAALASADVTVDALYGTGLSGEVTGDAKIFIQNLKSPVISADIPSGIDGLTGRSLGIAVQATETVTFGFAKPGLLCGEGFAHSGTITIADIGLGLPETAPAPLVRFRDIVAAPQWLTRPRPADAHKGSQGRIVLFAGSDGKSGAALLAAEGALRAGAGLVTLVTRPACRDRIDGLRPEIMVEAIDLNGPFGEVAGRVAKLIAGADAVGIGPGLGQDEAARWLVQAVGAFSGPVILDADALNLAAKYPELLAKLAGRCVMTPHPGELSRLTGKSVQEIQAHRLTAALDASAALGAVTVLKGHHSVVASPAGEVCIVGTGNPGMAAAGMGDVLTGVVTALAARADTLFAAAEAAVWWHGAAADWLAARLGGPGFTASEVAQALKGSAVFDFVRTQPPKARVESLLS